VGVDIQCQHAAGILHQRCQMRAFSARRGAGIDQDFSRLRRYDVSDQRGAFILRLTQSFPQESQWIVPRMAAYNSFRGPDGIFRFRAGFNQLLQQVFPGYSQRVGTKGKWRSGVVKPAKGLCFFDSQSIQPSSDQPFGVKFPQCDMSDRIFCEAGIAYFFRLPQGGTQYRINESAGSRMRKSFGQIHRLVDGGGIRHPVQKI